MSYKYFDMNTIHLTKKDFKLIWNNLKASAKKRNIPFELALSDLDKIGIPITCPILGIPLYFNRESAKDNSVSFDRIDSTKGYTLDNMIVISNRANKIKSNATLDEMKKIVEFYSNYS